MNILKWCLGILYPKTCCFCGKVCKTEICEECETEIVYIKEPRCKRCGKPVRYEEQEYCYDCQKKEVYYEQGKNIWLHKGKVSWSIYQFKYHNRRIYGEFYAKELFRLYGECIKNWGIEVIIPVPIHMKRKRYRGYNQAEVIANELGRLTGIPVDTKTVIRICDTRPQKELDDKERRRNLQKAFSIEKKWDASKRILLIDDIYTTGSTINAIAKMLVEKTKSKVWFLTISIGQDF